MSSHDRTDDDPFDEGVTWPVSRRALLRSAGATGAVAALAGCLGTIDIDDDATEVTVPEETARGQGFDPEPTVESHTDERQRDLEVVTVDASVTSHVAGYEYRPGSLAAFPVEAEGEVTADDADDDGAANGTGRTATPTAEATPTAHSPSSTPIVGSYTAIEPPRA